MVVVDVEGVVTVEVELGPTTWVLVAELTMKTGPAVTSFPSLVAD